MTALPVELPEGFTTLVAKGDSISQGQVIAKKDAPKDEIVNIIQALNVSRTRARRVLKKKPGDKIDQGDIIAIKKNLFGKVLGSITSGISGTVLRYERDTGNLVVRTDLQESDLELISPVAGTVTLCNNKEIVIETEDAYLTGGIAFGNTGEGLLLVLKESFKENGSDNALYYLDSRAAEKIVLVKTLTRDLIVKGDSIGVLGFLGTTISDFDSIYLQEKQIALPVIEISEELVPKLHAWEHKKVMLETGSKAIILQNS